MKACNIVVVMMLNGFTIYCSVVVFRTLYLRSLPHQLNNRQIINWEQVTKAQDDNRAVIISFRPLDSDYTVQLYNRNGRGLRNVLTIFKNSPVIPGSKPDYYSYTDGLIVGEVNAWHSPERHGSGVDGLKITRHYGAGSSVRHTILANINGHFQQILDDETSESLEWVDLDGDGTQEIIVPDDYRITPRRARIWQWSSKQQKYNVVRECSFKARLQHIVKNRKR